MLIHLNIAIYINRKTSVTKGICICRDRTVYILLIYIYFIRKSKRYLTALM